MMKLAMMMDQTSLAREAVARVERATAKLIGGREGKPGGSAGSRTGSTPSAGGSRKAGGMW